MEAQRIRDFLHQNQTPLIRAFGNVLIRSPAKLFSGLAEFDITISPLIFYQRLFSEPWGIVQWTVQSMNNPPIRSPVCGWGVILLPCRGLEVLLFRQRTSGPAVLRRWSIKSALCRRSCQYAFCSCWRANFFPISLDKLPQWEYNPRNLSYKLVIRFDIHPAYSLQDL